MASSGYKTVTIYSKLLNTSLALNPTVDFKTSYADLVESKPKTAHISSFYDPVGCVQEILSKNDMDYISFTTGNEHTCRETLLVEMFSAADAMKYYSKYRLNSKTSLPAYVTPVVFIKYQRENYENPMSSTHRGMVLEFSKKFLNDSDTQFYVQEHNRDIILSYRAIEPLKSVTASFILWIFRNLNVMSSCMQKFKDNETVSFKDLLEYLTTEILRNLDWEDEANPSILLSLFSFGILKQKSYGFIDFTSGISGPVNFSYHMYPDILLDYVENVLYKYINPTQKTYNTYSIETYLTHCPSFLERAIKNIYYILVRQASLEKTIENLKETPNGNT